MSMLVLDASGAEACIAWFDAQGNVQENVRAPTGRSRGGVLFSALEVLAKKFGRASQIVVGLGPGSYSGIRQLIATAQGLKLAWHAELIGWPSAAGIAEEKEFTVVGDARRGSYYLTTIREGLAVEGPKLGTETELREALQTNKLMFASETLSHFPSIPIRSVDATLLGKAVLEHRSHGLPAEPYYLRDPNITHAKNPPKLGQKL